MHLLLLLLLLLLLQGGGSTVFYGPTAVQVNASQLPHLPYKNPVGGIINVRGRRSGHWVGSCVS